LDDRPAKLRGEGAGHELLGDAEEVGDEAEE
jgi:hypothetical protein